MLLLLCSSPGAVAADDDKTFLGCDLFLTSGAVAAMQLT
jgi:hypothetical protein